MEVNIPEAGEPPPAGIRGVQFGLMSTSAILKLSVFDTSESISKPRELRSARLGLPTAFGPCTTCKALTVDQCQGHFGHVLLPTPIFHPNYVGTLVRLLRKICLNCGKPKSLRRKRVKDRCEQNEKKAKKAVAQKKSSTCRLNPVDIGDTPRNKRKFSAFRDEETEASEVIVLSSDEDDLSSIGKEQQETPDFLDDDDIVGGKASSSSARRSWNGKRKHAASSEANSTSTPTVVDLTNMLVCVKKAKKSKKLASSAGVEIVDDTFCTSTKDHFSSGQICLYCSGSSQSDRYPEVQLKVDIKGDITNLAKTITMEIKDQDYYNVAANYWSFVGGNSSFSSGKVPKTRNLLPSEALRILRKVPKDVFLDLGMQPEPAPPEALVVECLPVPPNCTRLEEDAFGPGGTNVGFKLGFDRGTQAFTKLLSKINSIKASRYSRPTFHAAGMEASSLQALFGQYLREKGAPKAAPGKEKKRTDHVGRVQKRNSRWSLDWLKRNVLGKRSAFSARNVVTGDPFLAVEEIGIPLEVAKYLTYPVRVTRLNQSKLQECVDIGQGLGKTRVCGAVRIVKNGLKLEVTPKSAHTLEIGDIVHRHLRDGDLLYVNRPPSLHKHSLIALKTHIQDSATFSINPAVCAPLHADFDGDCLHVFVPQSEESKAELRQLMSLPEQILPALARKTIIGVSQDNILSAHLVTSSPVFVDKELMHQLAVWSSWKLPVPTILKAPKCGPLWTGKQVIDLIIPDEFSYHNGEGTVRIKDGELLSYGGEENWLTSTDGLVSTLARHDPALAVKHLDCSQAVLREWLLSHGFSVSLKDFYAAPDRRGREMMKTQILSELEEAQKLAICRQNIFDRKLQKLELLDDERVSGATTEASGNHTDRVIEDVAVSYFLEKFSQIGEEIGEEIDCGNSLLAMVRSGSKGSVAKVFQQVGCLGLQLYKGERLLALQDNKKLCSVAEVAGYLDKWEARGLVRSSLVDGLEPIEFFLHAITVRAGLLRQSLEVTEPGELFKRLMLFLRDIHVSYDGTVRNKRGLEIVQFCYGGVEQPEGITDSYRSSEWYESVMPGEAVGILAATAIAQPAYQVMLEASHNIGTKKIRPLELLQETIFPRSTSDLKASDRRSVLRLSACYCGKLYCDERRALQIQSALQPIKVEDVARRTALEYIPDESEEWDAVSANGETQKLRMPWVGHILLDQRAMIEKGLNKGKMLEVLKRKVESHRKALLKFQLGRPLLYFRDECSCMGLSSESRRSLLCLHFSPMPKSNPKRRKAKVLKDTTMEIVDILQNFLLPSIMNITVKGDDRIQSIKILWEDAAWALRPRHSVTNNDFSNVSGSGELAIEVTIKQKFSSGRGVPWNITKEACLPIEESIDWRRSSPYSVQEMRYGFGVDAARDCILQRFSLASQASGSSTGVQHLKLVADLMVHSGEVHGLTSHGYRDLMRSLKNKAPLTAGAFRAPIKSFMEAGEKGEEEILKGVLGSFVFGKRVPVGTGADFSLKLNSKESCYDAESVDLLQYLKDLTAKIKVESPETPPQSEREYGSSSFKTGVEDAGGWDTGGWGSDKNPCIKGVDGGGWEDEAGGWDSPQKSTCTKEVDHGGWGDDVCGWGSPHKSASAKEVVSGGFGDDVGGWNSPRNALVKKKNSGGWSEDVSGWTPPCKTNSGGSGNDVDGCGSLDKTSLMKESNTDACEDEVNTTVGKSSNECRAQIADPEINARGVGGETISTPAKVDDSRWEAEDPPSAWSSKSDAGNDNAGAWIVPEDTQCPSGGDWGWDSAPKGSQLLSSPKVGVSSWTDSDVQAPHSLWDQLPSVQTRGCEEETSEVGKFDGLKKKGRELKPTGANTTPLGKVRAFKNLAGRPSAVIDLVSDDEPELVGNTGQEVAALCTSTEVRRSRVADSGPLVDPGTVFSDLSRSPRHLSQRNEIQTSGGWLPNKDQNWKRPEKKRELDPRKESEGWKELESLVWSIRNILKKYESEDRLEEEDHSLLLKQVLPNHPNTAAKIGCGIDYIKVANYMDTRCFFLVRKDGTEEDFSYHKCLLTLASRKKLGDLYKSQYMSRRTTELVRHVGASATDAEAVT